MADGSISFPIENVIREATLAQRRAWECAHALVMEFTERLPDDDLARAMDLVQMRPSDMTERDIDDATMLYAAYVEDRR